PSRSHPSLTLSSLSPTPPRSPPFPYTTLFRSRIHDFTGDRGVGAGPPWRGFVTLQPSAELDADVVGERPVDQLVTTAADPGRERDRKSTRLNSSHEWISYAVFCLKKKNNS